MRSRRALVIGLDAADPELVFDRFRDKLPNLGDLMDRGAYGRMRSCDPPITIPAWAVMTTSKNPGRLGMYGFRYRRDNSYSEFGIASSHLLRERAIWDILGGEGRTSCVIGVPPSYPPMPIKGWLISGMVTPSTERDYTYPSSLKREIEDLVGDYIVDVKFRTENREGLLKQIYEMTEKRFRVVEHLTKSKGWDLFMFVEIGLDRLHHAFWKFFDEQHHLYKPGSRFQNVVEDYYRYLDEKVGELLSSVGRDTVVLVVSDHGTKRMKGCFCINEWLASEGYLRLRGKVQRGSELDGNVDWGRTRAWGWGGYFARIFLNVKGREEKGIIDPMDYESVRDELAEELEGVRGPNGEKWETKAFKPEELYPECRGNPSDLMVYFDDLYWRSAGTIGYDTSYLPENDIGPDDAVHAQHGIFILFDPEENLGGGKTEIDVLDIAPTILHLMGSRVPGDMEGRVIEGIL